ncbi:hypothetical protein BCR43DRAFT_80069 [Syncephalastrum racemosum]|uniref:Uncharacterized protein n=1 Tax=Syncephalastrum racemosum TaxID=13706 RepID=A0A1X2H2W9_SYNRA|nr:hypothetical protein BCR43DRAFT_80069 [Syncephalastrum racemosum]
MNQGTASTSNNSNNTAARASDTSSQPPIYRRRRISSVSESPIEPGPEKPNDRMAALKDLGATFQEGSRRVSKVATPTDPEMVPSFVDTRRVEALKDNAKMPEMDTLQKAGEATMAD